MDFRRSAKKNNNNNNSARNNNADNGAPGRMVSTAAERAEEARKIASARIKPGSVTIRAKFLGVMQGKAAGGGGGQKATAIAGQGGGGGAPGAGGAAKGRDPPMQFYAIPFGVQDLTSVSGTATTTEMPDYKVIDVDTIEMPARDNSRIGKAKKALEDKEIKSVNDARVKRGEPPLSDVEIQDMIRELKEAQETILSYQRISASDTLLVKCFDPNAVKALRPNDIVHLVGFYPDGNYWNGELRISYACMKPIPAQSTGNALEDQFAISDINYEPVRIPNLSGYGGDSFILMFNDWSADDEEYYEQRCAVWSALSDEERSKNKDEEPVMFWRGPVRSKELANSRNPDAWLIKAKEAADRHKFEYTCELVQDGSKHGYPAGRYMVIATALDGDFSPEGQQRKTIRTAIGINDTAKYAAIMSTNSIPALITCSVNKKDMAGCNTGLFFGEPIPDDRSANIKCWANSVTLMLREYLCLYCPRVSEAWARTRYNLDPAETTFRVENLDEKLPCFLNMEAVTKGAGRNSVFRGPCAVLLDEWVGNVSQLFQDGGELRVLHSARITDEQRDWMAQQPEEVCEGILNRSDAARAKYPDLHKAFDGVCTILYCVKRVDLAEMDKKRDATNEMWRKKALARHKRELARKKEEDDKQEAAQIAAMEAFEKEAAAKMAVLDAAKKRIREEEEEGEHAPNVDNEASVWVAMQRNQDESPDEEPAFHLIEGNPEAQDGGDAEPALPVPEVKTEPAKPKKRKVKRTTAVPAAKLQSPGRGSPARGK